MGWLVDIPDQIEDLLNTIRTELLELLGQGEVVFWFGGISREWVQHFYQKRRSILGEKKDRIILVFDTPGGDADAAYQLVNILKSYCDCLEIVVPVWAKSAGTLVSLAAEKIYMTGISELGPLDPQIKEPGDTFLKGALDEYQAIMQVRKEAFSTFDSAVVLIMNKSGGMSVPDILAPAGDFVANLLQPLYYQIDPKILGKRARQLNIAFQYAKRILSRNDFYEDDEEIITELAHKLVYWYPSHSFVIDYYEANSIGLPVYLLEPNQNFEKLIEFLLNFRDELSLIGSFVDDECDASTDCKANYEEGEPIQFSDAKEGEKEDIKEVDIGEEGEIENNNSESGTEELIADNEESDT